MLNRKMTDQSDVLTGPGKKPRSRTDGFSAGPVVFLGLVFWGSVSSPILPGMYVVVDFRQRGSACSSLTVGCVIRDDTLLSDQHAVSGCSRCPTNKC